MKIVASGVCHSDLSVQNGTIPLPTPIVLGHEGAGHRGGDRRGRHVACKPGDHVVLSFVPACGSCFYCDRGQGFLCEKSAMAGRRRDARRLHPAHPRRRAAPPDGHVRHLRQLRHRAGDVAGEDRRRRRPALRRPHRLRRAHRRRRRPQHRQHPPGRLGGGRGLRRRGPQRHPGRQDRRRRADHRRRHVRVEAQDGRAVRRHRPGEGRRGRRRSPTSPSSPAAAASTWPSR